MRPLDAPTISTLPVDSSATVLVEARAAWAALKTGMDWANWIAVGRGLLECQARALEKGRTNDLKSYAYRKAIKSILAEQQLDQIDKADRSVLCKVMADLPVITAWRDTLTTPLRLRLNHPRVVLARYKTTIVQKPEPEPDGDDKPARPVPVKGFKAAYIAAEDRIVELNKQLRSEGPLFNPEFDTADQIARKMLQTVDPEKAEAVAHAMVRMLGAPTNDIPPA